MKRIPNPIRMVYLNIRAISRGALTADTPLELDFLLDGQLVRRIHRLRNGFMTEAVQLDGEAHRLVVRVPNGAVLWVADVPANPYSYIVDVDEASDWAVTLQGPMRPIPDTPHMERLIRVLTRAVVQMMTPDSPIASVYRDMQEQEMDYVWFEFFETAMRMRYEAKEGCRVDLWPDYVVVRPYSNVKDVGGLNVGQALQLEAALFENLKAGPLAAHIDFYYNEEGCFCAKRKER